MNEAAISAPADERGHNDPQSVACDATILPPCGVAVQPVFWPLARSAGAGGRARLPGPPGLEGRRLGIVEPGRLRPAPRFFYGVTLGHPTIHERIVYARAPRKLPTVLSADEVVTFLESVSSLKARVALTTAYAAGLRVSEVAALKVTDIDRGRMVMRIENGKGGKERYAMLSAPLLGILRSYWRVEPPLYLFPGRTPDKPIEPTVLYAACRSRAARAMLAARRRTIGFSSKPFCSDFAPASLGAICPSALATGRSSISASTVGPRAAFSSGFSGSWPAITTTSR